MISNKSSALWCFCALAVVLTSCTFLGKSEPPSPARDAALALAAAHGGMERWREFRTLSVDREHLFENGIAFAFSIDGDLHGRRIFQLWHAPAGTLRWDGGAVEAGDWPLQKRLLPPFVLSIGFYLVNLPWLVAQPDAQIELLPPAAGLVPGDATVYPRLKFIYTAPVLDDGSNWGGDEFVLYIDPETGRLRGVHQNRRWPPQLKAFELEEGEEAFQIYVINSELTVGGLVWPHAYEVFERDGTLNARGEFFEYEVK